MIAKPSAEDGAERCHQCGGSGGEGDGHGAPRMTPASRGDVANVVMADRPHQPPSCSNDDAYRNPAGIAQRSPIRNAPSINSAGAAAETAPAGNVALSL